MKTLLNLFALLATCLVSAQKPWVKLNSPDAKFSVSVPSPAKVSSRTDSEKGVSVTTKLWMVRNGSSNFVISVSNLPRNADTAFSTNMIAGIKQGMLNSTGGKETSDGPKQYAGVTGRLVTFDVPNGSKGAVWMISRNNRVYAFTVAKVGPSLEPEMSKFFGSIKFTG